MYKGKRMKVWICRDNNEGKYEWDNENTYKRNNKDIYIRIMKIRMKEERLIIMNKQ